jgi:putative SOS response-associated peptidase YedK
VTYYMYTADIMANEVINDRRREATKQRQWVEALKARRALSKAKS